MAESRTAWATPENPNWNQGFIRSSSSKEGLVYAGFAILWNLIAQPMFWLNVFNQPQLAPGPLLLTALFPLVGLALAYTATVKWLQWRRFGALQLVMDPFPGSLGGDVGGYIELPIAYRPGKSVEITLSCVNLRITGGGKNRTRHEDVLWRERATVPVEPGLRGSRAHFRFAVPATQPATSEPSRDCIQWLVHLDRRLPGANLDQTFELPVLVTDPPRHSRHIPAYTATTADLPDLPADTVIVEREADRLRLFYPAARSRGMGIMLLLFGAMFAAAPWFIITHFGEYSGTGFGGVFIAVGGLFVVVFGLVCLLLAGFGIYSLFNSLEVILNSQTLTSTRHFLGLRFRRQLQLADIKALRFRINAQQGHGARARVHYLLEAVPVTGKPVCLGDGIKGNPLAKRLMNELGATLGINQWQHPPRRNN